MNYEIIFYRSGKTSEIQNFLSGKLHDISLSLNEACAAVSSKELTEMLGRAIKRNRLILIVSSNTGDQGTEDFLDRILRSDSSDIVSKRIDGDNGAVCSIKCAKDQTIVILPDNTEDIISVLPELKKNLSDIYKLEERSDDSTLPDNIPENIEKNMAQSRRVRVAPAGSTAEKRTESRLAALKTTIAILLFLAAVQIGLASYLFLTQ